MKKFWCIFLIALLLLGCTPIADAPVIQVSPEREEPTTAAPSPSDTPEPTAAPTPTPTDTPAPTLSPEERLMRYVESMSLEERIGQLCMFGFTGTSDVDAAYAKILKTYHIGNVILFGQNISRTDSDGGFSRCAALCEKARAACGGEIPILISIDVEGGKVKRFRWGERLASAEALGRKNDEDAAYEQFRYIGEGLKNAGINTNLAPCLDICTSPSESFLGTRILSSDAEIAAKIGRACVEGLHESGCLSFVKHFPGHGGASEDPHEQTLTVDRTLDEFLRYESIPFEAALEEADGVMVAHVYYPDIDETWIASQSETFITGLLRETYGFSGVVMSDDFRMAGLTNKTSVGEAAVRFILAGGDLILCGTNAGYQKQIVNGLMNAVDVGTIPLERLNESVCRILTAKMHATGWSPFDGID